MSELYHFSLNLSRYFSSSIWSRTMGKKNSFSFFNDLIFGKKINRGKKTKVITEMCLLITKCIIMKSQEIPIYRLIVV